MHQRILLYRCIRLRRDRRKPRPRDCITRLPRGVSPAANCAHYLLPESPCYRYRPSLSAGASTVAPRRRATVGTGLAGGRLVAAQEESSVSSAAETPGRRGDILAATDTRNAVDKGPTRHSSNPLQALAQSDDPSSSYPSLHKSSLDSAGPTGTGAMAPGRIIVSNGHQESGNSQGPPLEHS